MALRSGHAAERVGQARGDGENGKHLQIIAERGGILEGMGAVGIEETAAIGAQHLDGFLRRDRALRDGLVGDRIHHWLAVLADHRLAIRSGLLDLLRFDQLHRVIRLQILHHSLRNQSQRVDDAHRQQHPQRGARHVHPEVADGFLFPPRDAANEGDGQRDADRRRREVVIGESGHLGEIAHRGLTRVVLPVGVGGEGRGGIEGQIRSDCGELLRIPRQPLLNPLDQIQQQHGDAAEQQHGDGILRPAHLVVLVDAGQAIQQALDRPSNRIEKCAFAVENPRHEDAQRFGDREDQRQKQQGSETSHWPSFRTSPASTARTAGRPSTKRRRPA